MPDRIRVACVQMTSRTDKAANLETAERLVAQAAATGADVVGLPEKWDGNGDAAYYHAPAAPRRRRAAREGERNRRPCVPPPPGGADRRRRVGHRDVELGASARDH